MLLIVCIRSSTYILKTWGIFEIQVEIFDVLDSDDLKILTLNYDGGHIEEFELSVLNDETIRLYHFTTATTYNFSGQGFIQYLKGDNKASAVRNNNRKRRNSFFREIINFKK